MAINNFQMINPYFTIGLRSSIYYFGATLPAAPQIDFDPVLSLPAASATPRGSYFTPGVGADSGMSMFTAITNATYGDVVIVPASTREDLYTVILVFVVMVIAVAVVV